MICEFEIIGFLSEKMKKSVQLIFSCLLFNSVSSAQNIDLKLLKSPVIFKDNVTLAYRDPAVLYDSQTFYLFFTLTEIEQDGKIYMYTATSKSADLINWSTPRKLTVKDQNLDFSSPGNIIRFRDEWLLCLQTYPRPGYTVEQMPKYGNQSARLYIMKSNDLENWSNDLKSWDWPGK